MSFAPQLRLSCRGGKQEEAAAAAKRYVDRKQPVCTVPQQR
jgi:hypothetical protein